MTITGADPTNPALTTIDAAGTPAIPRRVIEVASFGGATLKNLKVSGGLSAGGTTASAPGQSGTFGATAAESSTTTMAR